MKKYHGINSRVVILFLALFIITAGSLSAERKIENVVIATHSIEGNTERIEVALTEPFNGKLYLEAYQFHYIMLPELAPEEDTWHHERQMQFMEDVLSGNAKAYSPKETIPLETADTKTFYTDGVDSHITLIKTIEFFSN